MDEVSNNNYTLNLVIQQWKCVYQHLNYLTDKRMCNNCLLNNTKSIQSQRCKSFKQIRLCLRNVDESISLWKYYLQVQSHGNIYSCSISKEIYQQLTQYAVGNTPYITEGNNTLSQSKWWLILLTFFVIKLWKVFVSFILNQVGTYFFYNMMTLSVLARGTLLNKLSYY